MSRNVLVPVDGSAPSLAAATLAEQMAEGGTLTLFHALRDGPLWAAAGLDAAITAVTGASNAARESLRNAEKGRAAEIFRSTCAHLTTETKIHELMSGGRPADVVLEALESGQYDLVSMGNRGRGRLARTLLGSVSDAILRGARLPVLIARKDSIEHIVVAIDGTPSSRRATKFAGEIARATKASVTLVHAIDFPVDALELAQEEITGVLRANANAPLTEAEGLLGQVPQVERHIELADPIHAILDTASHTNADLIILGRQGETPSRFSTLGSVAHRIALNADASVLIVP